MNSIENAFYAVDRSFPIVSPGMTKTGVPTVILITNCAI
jgi:hypothetical protein